MHAVKTLVTGATGFIGNRLAEELVRRKTSVRVLVRRRSMGALTETPGRVFDIFSHPLVEVCYGDLLHPPSVREAVQGCGRVFHLAGYVKSWAPARDLYFATNVRGLRNILEAAGRAGVERVVWTSSDLTIGPSRAGEISDEAGVRGGQPCFTEYEESKLAAEDEAGRWGALGLDIVTVNPTRVFGPGLLTEGNSVTRLVERYLRGGFPVLLGGGINVGNWVLVDDVVLGLVQAADRGRPGERYILGGDHASLREFFGVVGAVCGRRRFQFPVRRPGALAFAYFQKKRADWIGVYPQITPGWVRTFLCDYRRSSAKAERELGYRHTPLEEGIRQTCRFLSNS